MIADMKTVILSCVVLLLAGCRGPEHRRVLYEPIYYGPPPVHYVPVIGRCPPRHHHHAPRGRRHR